MKLNKHHLIADRIYYIQSTCVARNPLFYNKALCERFLEKLNYYLSPICDILHYAIGNCEFQLIIKLHSKESIEAHWIQNKARNNIIPLTVPLVSHIFSKAMSDLLVSTVQHFNYHHQRKGGLMAHRFRRQLIKSKIELDEWLKRMDRLEPYQKRIGLWAKLPSGYRLRKQRRKMMRLKYRCARYLYRRKKANPHIIKSFRRVWELEVRACFKNLTNNFPDYKKSEITTISSSNKTKPPP